MMGRASQVRGSIGQTNAEWHLRGLGFRCIQEIATPVITTTVGKRRIIIGYKKKVCGDFHAIGPCGRSVLVEVKSYEQEKLPHNALEKHQWDHLREHAECGGLSLIAWHNRLQPISKNVVIMPFDAAPGWTKGFPLPWDAAVSIGLKRGQIPGLDIFGAHNAP